MSRTIRRLLALASITVLGGLLAGALPVAAWDGDRDDGIVAQITNVGIGSPSVDQRLVNVGASVTVSFDWMAANVANPESFLAINYGWNNLPKPQACKLVGNTHGNLTSGSVSTTLTAPSTPGSVYLRWEIVEDSCHGTTFNPWSSGASAPNPEDALLGRLWVKTRSVTARNVTISQVSLKGAGTDVFAQPGSTLSVKLTAKIDGRDCPTCRYRIVHGWADSATPSGCLYNAKPRGNVVTVTTTVNLIVPENPVGLTHELDRFVAFKTAKSFSPVCNATSWPGGSPILTPETSFIGHVAVQ